ncbi:NADP oxidoreductase [Leptospira perolatii]|uniref:NADP oxidoreductase n=1 Tax=Leptospira perolatii TaxID=2023191 RepID=A0A2M9ZRA2_9LEPT|nr:NAD(P)-binding domain-containing protein [Leptospira perolatii]PJZ70969.1 NADP oxidoreductase [Leptospira perolatii]PJZ74501.1 NADP oxidoreductase [Leptospira perolatii]
MKFGIIGTGSVGQTIGTRLVKNGHEVKMGSRAAGNEKAVEWIREVGGKSSEGSFKDCAQFGEILFNCTKGEHSVEALTAAGSDSLSGKILIDVSNPLDFSKGFPPSLLISNTNSLGETIQDEFPGTFVVKTLHTVNASLMVNPSLLPGEHDLFICGNSDSAKGRVKELLQKEFGWKNILDLGNITNARATEMLLPLWVRLYGVFQNPLFNLHIVK